VSFSDWGRFSTVRKIVLFSGGKDSLATLSLCREHYGNLEAVYVDTSAGFFEETVAYVKMICERLNVPVAVLKPSDFFELVSKWGFPSVKARWCCAELKLKPLKKYIEAIREAKVLFTGLRASESSKRRMWFEERVRKGHNPAIYYHPLFKCFSIAPIWDWSDRQVEHYLSSKKLPVNPAYRDNVHSLACPCVVFKTVKQIEAMRVKKPDLFNKFKELELKLKNKKWKPLRQGGKYLYFRDLEQQQLMDVWLEGEKVL